MGSELDKPHALTPDVQMLIIRFVSSGSYFAPACKAAGTTRQTVQYWQKLYKAGVEHAQVYAEFFAALEKAKALAEVKAIEAIQDGASSWQSRAWFLERRYPQRWAAKPQAEKPAGKSLIELVGEAEKIAEELERDGSGAEACLDAGQEPE